MALITGKTTKGKNQITFTHPLPEGTTILKIVDGVPTHRLEDGKWIELNPKKVI
jgi:hypothetical protein